MPTRGQNERPGPSHAEVDERNRPGPSHRPDYAEVDQARNRPVQVQVKKPKQKRIRWKANEEEALIRVYAVMRSGDDEDEDWITIKRMLGTEKTNVQLKDKVRNKDTYTIPHG